MKQEFNPSKYIISGGCAFGIDLLQIPSLFLGAGGGGGGRGRNQDENGHQFSTIFLSLHIQAIFSCSPLKPSFIIGTQEKSTLFTLTFTAIYN
jgi:hypothetical protein